MTEAQPAASDRLAQLYEISKLFTAFDGIESTLDAALKVIATTLPLESAILIESVIGGHTDLVAWPSEGAAPGRLRAAKAHARRSYAYLVGARSLDAIDVRERHGPSQLVGPRREVGGDAARYITIPLVIPRGAVFGALQLEGAARLVRADLEFVNAVANQLAIALDRNRAWRYDVSRRREAQFSQAKYETLVDHLDHAFVWEADATTRRVSYVSAQFEWMLGAAREDCLAEPDWWAANVHRDDRAELDRTFARALVEPGNQRCDHRCVAADGGTRWLHTSIRVVGIGDAPRRFQGVSFDVTIKRAAEERVRDQLSFASALSNSLGEATVATDLEGRVTFINAAAAQLLGCTAEAALGVLAASLSHLEARDGGPVESAREIALRTGARVRSDAHVIVRADGTRFAATYTAAPIWRDGLVVGAVVSFADTSEQRRVQDAEQFLTDASVALSASLELSAVAGAIARLAVPVLGDLCVVDVVSLDDRLLRVGCASADPATQSELDQRGLVVAEIDSPALREVIAAGRARHVAVATAAWCAAVQAPGTRREIRSALVVPLALGARALGAVTLCRTGERVFDPGDIALAEALARRSALALEHARVYEQARRAVALREQTLEIATHDLRSPLATIVLATTLLGDGDLGTMVAGSKALAVEKIQVAADRMDRLIGDLLDFASIEAGRLAIVLQAEDVAAIVAESTSSFEAIATKRQVALSGEVAAGLAAIHCDRHRILQVIANLLANALKVARPGDAVALRAAPGDHEVVFSVCDTGPGIAVGHQKHLFERYWRSPDASYKGNGLGLAIAQGIVEAHAGRIWVDSTPGHGATFSFTVPLAEAGDRTTRPLAAAPV